jgi:HEAT repeat protein
MVDQPSEASEELSFSEIITALEDEQKAIPARILYGLSGLEGDEFTEFSESWPGLSAQRRLALLEDLELLAEANTVMHFDAIGRLALNDTEEEIRVLAIRSLWQSQREDLIPVLIGIMNHDDSPAVRAQAASALGPFVLLGELGNISKESLTACEENLLAIMDMEDENPLVRRRALESLGYSSNQRVAGLIEDAFDFGDENLQASALYAMGRTADDRWAAQVLESLDDPNQTLSKEAIRAAGELEISDAMLPLLNLLYDEESEIRLVAAWSLSQIGGKDAVEALAELQERSESEDEIDLIEDAIENLNFGAEIEDLNLLDFSQEDIEELANPSIDDLADSEDS